jgi:hypothetical protein
MDCFVFIPNSIFSLRSQRSPRLVSAFLVSSVLQADMMERFTIGVAGATPVKEEVATTPNKFWLEQNYPNPFNLSTRITYNVPVNSNIKSIVYDVL